jgi:hypothetical protein
MLIEYKNKFFNPDAVVLLTPNAQVWTTIHDNCLKHRLTITVSLQSINMSVSIYTNKFITQAEYNNNVQNNVKNANEWIRKHIQDDINNLMDFINKHSKR